MCLKININLELSVCKRCQIENCKICEETDFDKCLECNQYYDLISPQKWTSFMVYEVSPTVQTMSSSTQAASGASSIATLVVAIMNLSSMAAIWSIVNQFQLFILLLLTKTPFPDDVKAMILGNGFMQFDLSIIPVTKIPKVLEFENLIDAEQPNVYLKTIGIESRISLKNNLGFTFWVIILILMYPLIIQLKRYIDYNNTRKCSWNNLMIKIVDLFNFIIYIRLILGAYQILMITSLSELNTSDFSYSTQTLLLIFSVIILGIWAAAIGLSFYIFNSTKNYFDTDRYYKLGEFITGIKNNKYARAYSFLALIRRTLLISWLILFNWLESYILSYGLLGVQVCYLICLVIIRPFDRVENNLIEIVNEIIYSLMIWMLVKYNTEEEWKPLTGTIFTGIIMSNSLMITLIMFGK